MNSEISKIVQNIANHLGSPWKFNHLHECNWSYEIIDGEGKTLFFRIDGKKFRIIGLYPRHVTNQYQDRIAIGVSQTRPAPDIAADIKRRLLPDYLCNYEKTIAAYQNRKQAEEHDKHILELLRRVSGGQFYHHQNKIVHFKYGKAELWTGDTVRMELNHISVDNAVRILAMLKKESSP